MKRKHSASLTGALYYGPSNIPDSDLNAAREKVRAICNENFRRVQAEDQAFAAKEEAEEKKQQMESKMPQKEDNVRRVYMVSCVSKKKQGRYPAKELNVSAWFKKAREYVEGTGCPWFILSAKYGLVEPDRVVESYNATLKGAPVAIRREWASRVLSDLRHRVKSTDRIVFLAGTAYREFLEEPLKKLCAGVDAPMEGLTIGRQLQWLSRQLARK